MFFIGSRDLLCLHQADGRPGTL